MTRRDHQINTIGWTRKGWQASCECGVALPCRRSQEAANRDGVDHLIECRLAAYRARCRRPSSFARAVRTDAEIAALLDTLRWWARSEDAA